MAMNKKGTTLVELILATLVLIIIAGVLSQILRGGLDSIDYGSKETELRQNGRVALERMAREIRQATDTPDISDVGYGGRKISFSVDMDDDDSEETIEYSWDGTSPGGNLVRTEDGEGGDSNNIIENSVRNFNLTRYPEEPEDPEVITLILTLEEVFGKRTHTVDLRSAIFLRRTMAP